MASLLVVALLILSGIIAYKLINRKLALRGHELKESEALEKWEGNEYILDVRTTEEYKEGHVPGATLIPLNQLGRRFREIPRDRDVYIMCRSGTRSAEATVWLLKKGFDNVYNISGGMLKWQGPVEK
ncbi:rhodanese-like domain-containing protein [Anaerospora hongkongensis]|uniref:rhodanese-like domain-containing protein n=1 Tax=Anaerospora hongkongensis TaxID=244830 RepID=UPI002896BC89|nr:rhodanese-like domain-containing protein [Anaerospora hongkongensis]